MMTIIIDLCLFVTSGYGGVVFVWVSRESPFKNGVCQIYYQYPADIYIFVKKKTPVYIYIYKAIQRLLILFSRSNSTQNHAKLNSNFCHKLVLEYSSAYWRIGTIHFSHFGICGRYLNFLEANWLNPFFHILREKKNKK